MLRRDRRRAQQEASATQDAHPVVEAPTSAAADAPDTVDEPSIVEQVAAEAVVLAVAAVSVAADSDAAVDSATPSAESIAADETPTEASAAKAPHGRATHTRPARTRAPKTRGTKRQQATKSPASATTPLAGRSSARRIGKMAAAALAVTALVGGTALPAIGMVQAGTSAATTSITADAPAQTFTAGADVMPDVVVRGEFSATTPAEVEKIREATAAAVESGVATIAKPGQVIIPMAEGTYSMTDGFGASRPGRTHMGQDYAAPIGTPIYAAADGVVTMSQDSYGGYGVTVQVQHNFGGSSAVSTLYGHMDYDTRAVKAGDHVVAGQFLGRVGTTGYTIGSCLHFEVRINGTPINPVPWLAANVR